MAVTSQEDLLMNILRCGTLDLAMIDKVGYDFCDIHEQLEDTPIQKVGFNGLMRAVVDFGIICIREALDERIEELKGIQDNEGLDDAEDDELQALEMLDPDEDIQSYHNCIDTHVWFEHHGGIYRRYLQGAVDDFEENTGFCIGGDEE